MSTNSNDNAYNDAMNRYADITNLNFGFCTLPFGSKPCPHHLGLLTHAVPEGIIRATSRKKSNQMDRMHELRLHWHNETSMAVLKNKEGNMTDIPRKDIPPVTAAGNASQAEHDQGKHPPYWLPTDDQWQAFIQMARHEPLRNQVMIFLAYEAALRSSELRLLRIGDVDLTRRRVCVRAETTKTRQALVVEYPESIHDMIVAYVTQRYHAAEEYDPLFPSDSSLNSNRPISQTTWAEIVKQLARRVGAHQFSPHTLRRKRIAEMWGLRLQMQASEEANQ